MKERILYLEGAGCAEYNGINCRCTSVFKDGCGRLVYAEASGFPLSKLQKECFEDLHRPAKAAKIPLYLNLDVYNKETNAWEAILPDWRDPTRQFPNKDVPYTLKNICMWLNRLCGTSFDRVIVLPWYEYAGYYTQSDDGTKYCRGDTFHYQPRITKKRQQKVAELQELHKKQFGVETDKTSYWVGDDKKLHMRLNMSDEKLKRYGYEKREYVIEI